MLSAHHHIFLEAEWGWNGPGRVWAQATGNGLGTHTAWAHICSYGCRVESLLATQCGCNSRKAPSACSSTVLTGKHRA